MAAWWRIGSNGPIRQFAGNGGSFPETRYQAAGSAAEARHVAAPSRTSNLAPAKSPPIGSARPPRVRRQERLRDGVEREAVLRHGKAVPLLGVEHVGDGQALGAHGGDDLVGLGLLDARVVGALADQQRLGDGAGRIQRRALLQQLAPGLGARIADAPGTGSRRRPPSRAGWSPAASRGWTGRRCRRRSRTPPA